MKETIKDRRGMKIGSYDKQLNGKITIYDKSNVKIGEIKPEGSYLVAYDKRHMKMAKWNERDDCTYDKNNRKIGKGNLLIGMYFEE